jgi:hypothetical protein
MLDRDRRNVVIGYLPQGSTPVADETVIESATAISPGSSSCRVIKAWEHDHPIEPHTRKTFRRCSTNTTGSMNYQIEARPNRPRGSGLPRNGFDQPAKEMSSGWVCAHWRDLLTQGPDLLMLDEPTDHLTSKRCCSFRNICRVIPAFSSSRMTAVSQQPCQRDCRDSQRANSLRYRGSTMNTVQRDAAEVQLLAPTKSATRNQYPPGLRAAFRQGLQSFPGTEQADN